MPHHAAKVRDFEPKRSVGWLQDELQRFHDHRVDVAEKEEVDPPQRFTLHDYRRTAITGMQMAGVSEKEASVMVGATPEVIRRHYEKLDQLAIAKRNVERRLGLPENESLRISYARPVDNKENSAENRA